MLLPLHAHSCGAVVVVQLLYTATTTSRSSANNHKQQCCWLSMSIGGSSGTAVKSDTLVGAPFWYGGGCLLCLPFVASAASVLCCLTVVPYIICPGMYTYVFWVGAVFCDRLPFHRWVVSWFQSVRQQSSLLFRRPPPSRLLRFVPCISIAIRLLHFLPSSKTSAELCLPAQNY